ncbi:MAG: hypothetical protein JST59_07450 [Actinobacteria bacterium]|nr:hypothetical protein [Actinomycetota bacterium]
METPATGAEGYERRWPMIGPEDDLRHEISGAAGRESLWFNVSLEDEGLAVLAYTWVGVDGQAGSLLTVVDSDDRAVVQASAADVDATGMDFDAWQVGDLRVRTREPLQVAELSFSSADAELDLTYTGMHDAFAYGDHPDGCPQYVAKERFEQSCRVRGSLTLGDREIAVDTRGHRDHSWGTREWNAYHHWKWMNAQTDEVQTNLFHCLAYGRSLVNGYVARGGTEISPIVAIDGLEMTHDDDWSHRHVEVAIHTADGRTLALDADRYARFSFPAGESIVLDEVACTGTLDGEPASMHVEMGWDRTYAARQQSRLRGAAVGGREEG